MLKKLLLVIILLLSNNLFAQTATAPSGSGTSGDPYLIATLDNLYWVTQTTGSWTGKYFKQTADIDASSSSSWDSNQGFNPIGNSPSFSGTYDGNGFVISGVFINRPSTIFVGLFGVTNGSVIKNLGVTNVNITGFSQVGGLIGSAQNGDIISNCFSTGSVTAVSAGFVRSGGLIGFAGTLGAVSITDCYSVASVTGDKILGGLVGALINSSTLSNCYSTGLVTGNGALGGLIGANSSVTVSNSFWDTQTSGQSGSAGGTGKTTTEMQTQSTYTDAGWDFTTVWNINGSVNGGYPTLKIFLSFFPSFMISGNAGTAGAVLSYTDGTAKTDTSGTDSSYSFTVSYNWSGTVTPTKAGYTFTPSSKTYSNITSDQTGQDYSASTVTLTISGKTGVAGAVLSYTDGTAKTDTSGTDSSYSFTVSYNWSGTVTPTKAGYTFTPSSKTYSNITSDQTGQDYNASTVTLTISGKTGVAGAVLSYTDGTAKTDTSGTDSSYSFTVSYNWSGTVTPAKAGYTFTPVNKVYTNITSDQTNEDYTALIISGIEDFNSIIPKEYSLFQNYPNPFNPTTIIRFGIPQESNVKIMIYNMLGQEVQRLFSGNKSAGFYEISFDAGKLSSGMYIYRIEAGSFVETKKMLLMK